MPEGRDKKFKNDEELQLGTIRYMTRQLEWVKGSPLSLSEGIALRDLVKQILAQYKIDPSLAAHEEIEYQFYYQVLGMKDILPKSFFEAGTTWKVPLDRIRAEWKKYEDKI